jgi:hypothetical protein
VVVAGLDGVDRAMLYRVAATVALRAGECASLTPDSFVRELGGMSVRVAAAYSKHRREDSVPVPVALADVLEPWLATKQAGKRLWPTAWHVNAAEMLRHDLLEAGIEYETEEGFFDFHATRHTGITRGSRVMRIDQLRVFARHAKIETTMGYVHTDAAELRVRTDLLVPPHGSGGGEAIATRTLDSARRSERDQKRDRAGVAGGQVLSSAVIETTPPLNDTTPCKCRGLSSTDTDCHQRERRGSNPQPPDRQSGTLTN